MEKIKLFDSYKVENITPFYTNQDAFHSFQKKKLTTTIPPSYLFTVHNALVSPYGVIFKNGRAVAESIYANPKFSHAQINLSFYKKIIMGKVRKVEGECFVFHHGWFDNYYHWLIEMLPRLYAAREHIKNCTLLLHESIAKYHYDSISLFKFKDICLIKDAELVRASKLMFPSFINFVSKEDINHGNQIIKEVDVNFHKPVMQEMAGWLKEKCQVKTQQNRKIFISRQKAKYRKLMNYKEVKIILDSHNIEEVFLEELSFKEQVNMLANTKLVVCIHGAGVANTIFMPQNGYVLNFTHKDYHEYCFQTIAHGMDLKYANILCNGNSFPNPQSNDVIIDTDILNKLLSEIENNSIDETSTYH